MKITENVTDKDKAITTIAVEIKAENLERFLIRSEQALNEAGIYYCLGPDVKGVSKLDFNPPVQKDDPHYIEDMLTRLEKRANRKLSETDHPFTFYDFKQALGIVADVKAGLEVAMGLSTFLEGRRIPKPTKVKAKAPPKKGKVVSLKPVPESNAATDEMNKDLEKAKAKAKTKTDKIRAKADAELKAEMDAVEEALEKEHKDIKKTKKTKTK